MQITPTGVSEYVVRTQPTEKSLSTVECAAMALEVTEHNSDIKEVRKQACVLSTILDFISLKKRFLQILLKPLRGLCQFQLDHGAMVHHSKEFLVNGTSTN